MKPGSITLELKTLYAYDSILFGIIADSRRGIHVQIDIRKYFKPGGHHPMDQPLIDRILAMLLSTRKLQRKLLESSKLCFSEKRIENQKNSSFATDIFFGPHCIPPVLDHLLGPSQEDHRRICSTNSFLFAIYQKIGGKEKIHPVHCPICTKFSG